MKRDRIPLPEPITRYFAAIKGRHILHSSHAASVVLTAYLKRQMHDDRILTADLKREVKEHMRQRGVAFVQVTVISTEMLNSKPRE